MSHKKISNRSLVDRGSLALARRNRGWSRMEQAPNEALWQPGGGAAGGRKPPATVASLLRQVSREDVLAGESGARE